MRDGDDGAGGEGGGDENRVWGRPGVGGSDDGAVWGEECDGVVVRV